MFIPEVSASNVAGLIGLHTFKPKEEVMYALLCKNKLTREVVKGIEARTHRRPFDDVCKDLYKDKHIGTCINQGIRKAQETSDVQSVLDEVKATAKTVVELRWTQYPEDVRARLIDEVAGIVSKQRGLKNENTILNTYETEREVKVTDRNTKTCRKDFPSFKLIGRIDGYVASENRIVDSKDRTRFWDQVPLYDEIQLRCYMTMLNASESELIERFPDNTTRHTKYLNDPVKWKVIEDAITESVKEINQALANTNLLEKIIFANTVCIQTV